MLTPTTTTTRQETYYLRHEGDTYQVRYIHNSIVHQDGSRYDLDDHAILEESLVNQYESPALGTQEIPEGSSRGHIMKDVIIRRVTRDVSTSGRQFVEIHQWKDIPQGLEDILDDLPEHVKLLLRKEYSDPGVTPYTFDFPESEI